MRLLLLSDDPPDFFHFRASQTVLATLAESLGSLGHQVFIVYLNAIRPLTNETKERLERNGVTVLPMLENVLIPDPKGRWPNRMAFLREILLPNEQTDRPQFSQPRRISRYLEATQPDAAILFWDTAFDRLISYLNIPVIGYLARPPFAAPQARTSARGLTKVAHSLRFRALQRKHFARARHLKSAVNICAIDAAWYSREGIECKYLSNTWPDAFGDQWANKRSEAEATRNGIHMLGSIGGLQATGNIHGMSYLNDFILPHLDHMLSDIQWSINICGRGSLEIGLNELTNHPHIHFKGFVDDIDNEVLANSIFLLFNNAGPYTGGYTRVIYAFSSGACLIAHQNLALSMPELINGKNCLLGDSPETIAALINLASHDANLRYRLGFNARQTYESIYAPVNVAHALTALINPIALQQA